MRRYLVGTLALTVAAALGLAANSTSASGAPAAGAPPGNDRLDAYTAVVDAEQLASLAQQGMDVSDQQATAKGIKVGLVLTKAEQTKLAEEGIEADLTRVKGGQTVRQFAAAQAASGFNVWRSYDEPGGIRDQLYEVARDNKNLAKLVKIGTTAQGREILALKLTGGARTHKDGARPAVLYSATQHAREWIATEVDRRLMNWYVDEWNAGNPDVVHLLRTTELWFVLVANPDGYQYTFDTERLWRKNLRDNNGDGMTQVGDGVDPNRNYPNHWGYDNEGSSDIPSSDTYRGPAPASEPETRALMGLMKRVGFAFQVNWHSNGQWLLYTDGWQIGTATADDPIYYAMSGNLDQPAIPDFHPGLSSDVLYVTNGEVNDYAHAVQGTMAWTPELSAGCDGCGFVFPDDDALVQAEFERVLPFAQSAADSARNPANPKSAIGLKTKPLYVKSDDPYKEGIPGANFTFKYSYGDPQPVAVLAQRSLGKVMVKYRINDGRVRTGRTWEWRGGEKYGQTGVYYRQMRGVVHGTDPGDSVEVWFTAKNKRSDSFTYEAVSDTNRKVLVVAAEDYTGLSPAQDPAGPHYASYYLDALAANGIDADLYDVDASERTAPDQLGVLSHYDAVVWYPGDDIVTRRQGQAAGDADRLALDEMLEMRAYMNEGGKVLYTGDTAGYQYTGGVGNQLYDPQNTLNCSALPADIDPRRCLALRGSGDGVNDVLQYYFGGYLAVAGDGLDENGEAFDLTGTGEPFEGQMWTLNGGDSAANQDITQSFIATSGILPADQYPQFESWPSSRWDRPGGPFDPHTGSQYVYSQIADVTYKRLTREIAVPAAGGTLDFWTSYDTEADWDHVFVEAHTPSQDDWTTLPDANGHTVTAPGASCAASTAGGWMSLHPQLLHYVTRDEATATCTSTGTTGEWNAASGSSGGWQEWSVDLSDWAGGSVEVSITYASDWSAQNLGVFVDDVTLPDGTSTSFEDGLDGWTVAGAPEGSAANANDWIATDASGFPVGASISTPSSILMGYGIEGISTAEERNAVMGRAMDYLLGR